MSEQTAGATAAPSESTAAPAAAEAPAPNSAFEVLTPAERAYLDSGGEKTEGLFDGYSKDDSGGGEKPEAKALLTPDGAPVVDAAPPEPAPKEQQAEELEPGEITLDADGTARNAKNGRFVPHAALHQERKARQELAAQLESLRVQRQQEAAQYAQMQERLAILQEAFNTPEGEAGGPGQAAEQDPTDSDVPIDPEVDIFGAFKQLQKQLVRERTQRESGIQQAQQTTQQMQAQTAEQQLQRAYQDDALHFAQSAPDFGDAYRYLGQARAAELKAIGAIDDAQIPAQLIEEERQIVIHAIKSGRRPSQIVYDLAKAKGYRGPAPAEAAAPPAQVAKTNGGDAIAAAQKGQKAAATLSGGGGGTSESEPTMATLASMDDATFEAFVRKNGMDKVNRILGK